MVKREERSLKRKIKELPVICPMLLAKCLEVNGGEEENLLRRKINLLRRKKRVEVEEHRELEDKFIVLWFIIFFGL